MIRKLPFPLLLFLLLMSGCGRGGSEPAGPRVTQTDPSPETKNVPIDAQIKAHFSSPIDPVTVNQETFIVGGVFGKVSYQDQAALFIPSAETPLERGKEYHVVLTTGIKDLDGMPLASNLSWSFITEGGPDTTRPRIRSLLPLPEAKEISAKTPIAVVFSEPMDPASVIHPSHFFIKGNVPGEYRYDPQTYTVTFLPSQELTAETTYLVTVKSGVKDLAGNTILQEERWSFTTRSDADTDPPQVEEHIPENTATDVAVNSHIQIRFNEGVQINSLPSRVLLMDKEAKALPTHPLLYDLSSWTATLDPIDPLVEEEIYQVIIKAGVEDLSGNRTPSDVSWFFNTGRLTDTAPPFVVTHFPEEEVPVPVKGAITAQFNEPLDAHTVAGNFKLLKGGHVDSIPGVATYDPATRTARFNPSAPRLEYNRSYTVFLTDDIEDLAGNGISGNFSWTFTTVSPPQVESHAPTGEGVSVTAPVTALFSRPMNNESIGRESVRLAILDALGKPVSEVPGSVRYDADRRMAVYTPDVSLFPDTLYQMTLTAEINDTDQSTGPADGAVGVPAHSAIEVLFTEAISPGSVNRETFQIELAGDETEAARIIPGLYRVDAAAAAFTPNDPLAAGRLYRVKITSEVNDLAGNPLEQVHLFSFTTAP